MPKRPSADRRRNDPQVAAVLRALRKAYPQAECALRYETPFQLLVATILSAQGTDARVNEVTRTLFARYPGPREILRLGQAGLEKMIHSTGFFRNKAKAILGCCRALESNHGGEVPAHMEELTALPGVGRKTANVVLGTAFGKATGIVVDTHVARIARRLGLSRHTNPDKIEQDLMAQVPKRSWIALSHRLIQHGREVCRARRPLCASCVLEPWCPRIGVPAAPARRKK